MCDSTGNIWPKPLNYTVLKQELVWIDARYPIFATSAPSNESSAYLNNLTRYFLETIRLNDNNDRCDENMYYLVINLLVFSPSMTLNWDTLEDYKLKMSADDSGRSFSVAIEASTVFGARHGLETFLQLLQSYDVNEQTCFVTLKELVIEDKPYYKHRGLLLDSARNYLSIETIKKNIVGMAMSKMNVLHWHLSDSQSFPFVSTRLPNMSFYGAYSEKETYTPSQITELLQFAKLHGVQIIPEIDGPAHAGSGWQWGADAGLGHLVLCYNQLPYKSYCIQPPCGQMNPANPKLYDVLKELYADISQLWSESNVFHMGGDEVNVPCWNSSEEIINYIGSKNRSEEAFLHLWGEFQSKALDAYDVASDSQKSIILWTSTLTDPKTIEKYLSKNRYVIQTWVRKSDHLPADLEKLGYRLIISTKDSWYLDHGFWGTTTYYSWQTIYDNQISNGTTVLGGEVRLSLEIIFC
ncbi:hypothetical protein ABEB36_011466 [Hypothenemus hampei]|uniref:beta-N-acetylhexosaminidase n=1 Tax=Hypothenemus hampei TaxID=57062 RepID=A0ABD1EG16_HYPHA